MINRRITLEHGFYALAFLLALGVRFLRLGALPLSDFEADGALRALQIVMGLKPAIGSNPAYVHLTSILFFVFGATNFMARFFPALAGTALVLVPALFRDRLGRISALLLAFFLAFDPGLVALSRLADGPILVVTFLLLTWGLWRTQRRTAAGVCAALALLSGPAVWFGLVVLVLAWALGQAFREPAPVEKKDAETGAGAAPARVRLEMLGAPLGWGAATFLLVGTLFLFSSKGIGGPLIALTDYLKGWWTPSGVPAKLLLIALPGYGLMALAFGLTALVRGALKRDLLAIRLGLVALVALLLALAYPARQTGDLIWAFLPLWVLAALELSRHFDFAKVNSWELAGATVLTLAILTFAWFDVSGVAGEPLSSPVAKTRLLLVAGALLLLALSLLLVAMGWSADAARLGAVWGAAAMLAVFTVGAATGAAGLQHPLTVELWPPAPQIGEADLLVQTAGEISDWSKGHIEALPVAISGVDSPALRWALRNWDVHQAYVLSAAISPALVITPQGTQLNLAAAYRGEGFIWRQTPTWNLALFGDWSRWFLYHQMPVQNETIVLWVRSDLLLDSQGKPATP